MKKSLNYIIKVAEIGNINRAAEKLFITPSALSKYILTKERELGVDLFDRSGKKFVLTYAGERYVNWAKKIVQMLDGMEREMESIAQEKTGIIHFGFQLMLSKILFSKIIPEFKEEHSDIDIVMESSYTLNLINLLEEGLLDFAVTSYARKKKGFIYKKLNEIEIVLIVPKGHPIGLKAEHKEGFRYPWVDIRELEQETFVGLYAEQEPRKIMDALFEKHGISPKISLQVHTTELSILSVANQFGITIGYDLPAQYEEYADCVELLSFGDEPVMRELAIIYKEDSVPKHYDLSFFNLCKKHL
ncbi:MAG: LysR family transcriptional regulator [Spirochaetales bacterium]|nr:LysR family transcriptional regulator [Spirochaetales bacterium]